jgi:HEAT repeat protein
MPFVKSSKPPDLTVDKKPDEGAALHVAALSSPDAEVRRSAARALGGRPDAVAALAKALSTEQVARVREGIMTALVRVGDEASVRALLPYLRSQDAGQRATAIEALQALPEAIMPFMAALLGDKDTDVRILATELTRNMAAKDANRLLCSLLENEQHPNVCAAAVDVLAEVGTRDAIPMLKGCAKRFSNTPFLPFAVATTIARISDAED